MHLDLRMLFVLKNKPKILWKNQWYFLILNGKVHIYCPNNGHFAIMVWEWWSKSDVAYIWASSRLDCSSGHSSWGWDGMLLNTVKEEH